MAKGSLSPALFLAVFLFFSEAVAATAENETDKVTASVITSSEKVNPTQDIDVLIRLQMHDEWHTYCFFFVDLSSLCLTVWYNTVTATWLICAQK